MMKSMWKNSRQYLTINHPEVTKKQIHFPVSTMRRDLSPASRQQATTCSYHHNPHASHARTTAALSCP
ncbi:unnamed protein product [Chondrus crispus]|uniref:Uncharacterized protein n=1 Tax=Chondrus crispus TaxID=2769 RepID=S0F377_CHOCR|nr:unnamed protein product [Chondrus crispus]CDF77497.1 unnamed protein product [Chondrus crispus]|eukprot:XP_005712536.1 unnamed protein product [Chondrus crispus]